MSKFSKFLRLYRCWKNTGNYLAMGRLGEPENKALEYIQNTACKNNANSVLSELTHFNENIDMLRTIDKQTQEYLESLMTECSENINNILEIGTYIGYSAITMAHCIQTNQINAHILSIDKFQGNIKLAQQFIDYSGYLLFTHTRILFFYVCVCVCMYACLFFQSACVSVFPTNFLRNFASLLQKIIFIALKLDAIECLLAFFLI